MYTRINAAIEFKRGENQRGYYRTNDGKIIKKDQKEEIEIPFDVFLKKNQEAVDLINRNRNGIR